MSSSWLRQISPHIQRQALGTISSRRLFSVGRTVLEERKAGNGPENNGYLPTLPKAVPTKQELLSTASGFLSRLRIRAKWALTRSNRPFRMDDYSAFFSWFIFAHIFWIVAGTTTFVSLGLVAINTVSAQEYLASKVGQYLTASSGVTVVFESAIVPQWKGGCITFSNVFVSRRPKSSALPAGVRKGSLSQATAEAAAKLSPVTTIDDALVRRPRDVETEEDTNYTQFDLTIENVNVTLSFIQWWNGKGLLKSVELKGIRGVVDRTSVHWDPALASRDPLSFRREPHYGDFELESFKLEDLLVTVHQPHDFRPFTASIFSCDLPRLRRRFLFYDLLCANHMSGSYDNSLITLHPKQSFHTTAPSSSTQKKVAASNRESRFRMDAIKIDHINKGVDGAMGWITEGTCDVVADIKIPMEDTTVTIVEEVIQNIAESVHPHLANSILSEGTLAQSTSMLSNPPRRSHASPSPRSSDDSSSSLSSPSTSNTSASSLAPSSVVEIDVQFRLNDAKAHVPLVQHEMSYINAALVRPIVAYINSRKTVIPVHALVTIPTSNFEGAWTWWDCGLQSAVSLALYDGFVESIYERRRQKRRMQAVGFWSLQMMAQLIMVAMKNVVPSTG